MLGACWPAPRTGGCVAVYRADDPAGFGPALQVVASGGMLIVTLRCCCTGPRSPASDSDRVRRAPQPRRRAAAHPDRRPGHVAWVSLDARSAIAPLITRPHASGQLLPKVLADVQRVATDAAAIATLSGGRSRINAGGRFSARPTDRRPGNCCVGWVRRELPAVLGTNGAELAGRMVYGEGQAGHGRPAGPHRFASQLTDDKLLVLAQAPVGSCVTALSYAIAVARIVDGSVVEHPLRRAQRRGHECGRAGDPDDLAASRGGAGDGRKRSQPPRPIARRHPDRPRPELFTLSAQRLLTMARAVVDLGSQRRCCSCARIGCSTSCRAWSTCPEIATPPPCACNSEVHPLSREFERNATEFTARVSESP